MVKNANSSAIAGIPPLCSGCGTHITKDMKALQCDLCQAEDAWQCVDCLHLSSDMYDQLVEDGNCSLRWFCGPCDKSVMENNPKENTTTDDRVDSLISLVEKLMDKFEKVGAKYHDDASKAVDTITKSTEKLVEKINEMEKCLVTKADKSETVQLDSRVTEIEQKLENVESQITAYGDSRKNQENVIMEYVEKAVEAKNTLDVEEMAEKEKHKTSVIIHGIKESESENSREREEDDLGVVASMLHELKCEDAAVQQVVRLGKHRSSEGENAPTKPPPMKMVAQSEE